MSVKSRPQKCRIGYARISTLQQDLTRQIQALKSERCDKIFSDAASGKSTAGRPELAAALAALAPGDELVLAEWDRATRSMWDGMDIIKTVIDAEATIRVLDRSYIDLETPMGRGFMALFSAMAEDERNRIVKRTHEGRKVSQARGVKMGRKEKLNDKQKAEARQRLANGEFPSDLAPLYGVSRPTIARLRYGKEKKGT
jgi:DNA invertase Pin-like site-specific DNA recombinase